ncbi:MAG: phytoene desaturase, partial [Frankiaceae bacterium]|nr:phytoene desaturase [Frankiaceae bacterium]
LGGKAGSFGHDAFRFDTGPSLITLPATIRDLFRKTGKPVEAVLELRPLDQLAHYRFADGTELDVPNSGVNDVAETFQAAFGGRAGEQWRTFYERAERTWDVVRTPFVESALDGPAPLLRMAATRPRDVALVAPWRTLRALGMQSFDDPRLRVWLDRYATYSGSDPRKSPAVLSVVPYVEHAFGGWEVVGGVRRLVDAMYERATDRGAKVRTGAEVVKVTTSSGRATGVVLADGEVIPADIVVSDVDATVLYSSLLDPPRPAAVRRLRNATPSSSGFVLLLALRGRTPGLRRHTVLFGDDTEAEFDAVFGPDARPPERPTIYISATADDAPPDCEAWFVLVNAPRHGSGPGAIDWTAPGLADRYADEVLAAMAARGIDVRDRVVFREIGTPADLEAATGSPGGAIYGTSSNGWRAATLRPANRSPVEGLFLVGGSVHPGGGIPLVLMSAALVAEMIGRA